MSDEFNFCLPPGWAVARIYDLIGPEGVFTDGDWIESKDQDPHGDVRLIQLADIGDATFRSRSSRFLTRQKAEELSCTFLRSGDILVARMPDPLGRACIFPGSLKESITAVDVCIIRSGMNDLDNRWLMWAINSPEFRRRIGELQSGTTRQRISRRNLATLPLPLPPAAEQRRIADEVEKQISRLDSAVEALKRAAANLKIHRTSILKSACEGRLVPTEAELARAEGRVYETATEFVSVLLEKKGRDNPPYSPNIDGSVELPEGWTWVTIDQICELDIGFAFRSSEFSEDGIRLLRGENIEPGSLRWEDVRHWPPSKLKGFEHLLIQEGDIIVAMDRPIISTGLKIARAIAKDLPCLLVQRMARFRPIDTRIASYLYCALRTMKFADHLRKGQTGTQLPHISGKQICTFTLPLPPVAEQARITEEVERRLSFVEQTEITIKESLTKAESLRQSLLRKAFEGRLVSQIPHDEPAHKLLAHIRESRGRTNPNEEVMGDQTVSLNEKKPSAVPSQGHTEAKRIELVPPSAAITPEFTTQLFTEMDPTEKVEAAWRVLLSRGALPKEASVRMAAELLREAGLAPFQRLRRDGPLFAEILWAIEHGVRAGLVDRPKRGYIRAILPDPKAYSLEQWRLCLLGALNGEPVEEEDALRAAAEWARENMGLEFVRLREDGVILQGLRAALKEAMKRGEITRRRNMVFRSTP